MALEETAVAPLLRFATAGSVDDGKSTLIGRLLFDSKQVFEDQLAHVLDASRRRSGAGSFDLSLLTDGLRAEREQGITIDVAYRYFATARRRFIIADTPGHKQYTRNMATGASTAEASVVLLDAQRGVFEQSRRHAYIASLLGIPHLAVCVNKMDLVDWQEDVFDALVAEFSAYVGRLGFVDIAYIPISALHGDNVVERSAHMDWYRGPTLLGHLETVEVEHAHPEDEPLRLPVQWVIRAGGATSRDYRGYAGQLQSGLLRPGDEVLALPSGQRTRVAAIDTFDGELEEATAPLSVAVRLEDELDISRGEMLCHADTPATVTRELSAALVWMDERPLSLGDRLLCKQGTATVPAVVDGIRDRLDIDSLVREPAPASLELNDVGHVRLRTAAPLCVDDYRRVRHTGSFILIDETTNATVAAGMIEGSAAA
jgi:sulfate adenylyltransferase large subunit